MLRRGGAVADRRRRSSEGDVMIAPSPARSRRRNRVTRRGPSTAAMRRGRGTSSVTAARPTSASSASRPRTSSCSRTSARFGCGSRARAVHPHGVLGRAGCEENSIVKMRGVLDRVLEWLPTWEEEMSLRRRPRGGERRRDPGRLRLARVADAARDRPVPRPARAAATCRWRRRAARRSSFARVARRRRRGGLRHRAGREIDEKHPLVGVGRGGARGGLRLGAGA